MKNKTIGTYNSRTSRAPITTPSAPPPGFPPTKCTWTAFLAFPSPCSTPQTLVDIQASSGAIWLTSISLLPPKKHAYRAVRELHAINVSRLNRRNAPIMCALRRSPPFTIGGLAWIYNSAPTNRQRTKKRTDAIVLKTKLSFNWIYPFKILAVGSAPASAIPDGRSLRNKLLLFDLPSDVPGRDSKPRVSVLRGKPCGNPDDIHDLP